MTLFYFDDTWLPTSENINALPASVRNYVHDLMACGDYSFQTQELVLTKDQVTQLGLEISELQERLRAAAINDELSGAKVENVELKASNSRLLEERDQLRAKVEILENNVESAEFDKAKLKEFIEVLEKNNSQLLEQVEAAKGQEPVYQTKHTSEHYWVDTTKSNYDSCSKLPWFETRIIYALPTIAAGGVLQNGQRCFVGSRYVGDFVGIKPETKSCVVFKEGEYKEFHPWQINLGDGVALQLHPEPKQKGNLS